MKCETAQQVFSDYFEKTIERPLALTLEHHLNECEECRRAYGNFRGAWRALEEAFPAVEPPSGFRASVLGKVEARQIVEPREATISRLSLRGIFGARVPARAFAWACSVLVFAVLLVKVSPGVFQSAVTGPSFGSLGMVSLGPGMEIGVRPQAPQADREVYDVVLRATAPGNIEARLCRLDTGEEFFRAQVTSDEERIPPLVVKQPRSEPVTVSIDWSRNGRNFAKLMFLPKSQSVSEPPYFRLRNATAHDALCEVATAYGVVVIVDAGVKGSVTLTGRYDNAYLALRDVGAQTDLRVIRQGPRAFRLESR